MDEQQTKEKKESKEEHHNCHSGHHTRVMITLSTVVIKYVTTHDIIILILVNFHYAVNLPHKQQTG